MFLRIGAVARELGVTNQTLHSWRKSGKVNAKRVGANGHWLFELPGDVESPPVDERVGIIYVRVSTRKQSLHIQSQIEILLSKYPSYEVIQDVGSGLNFKRKGLLKVLDLCLCGKVHTVCVTHKDRLCRFAFDLFEHLLGKHGTKISVDAHDPETTDSSSELSDDILSIITVFGARLHGARSGACKRAKKARQIVASSLTAATEYA